MQTIDQVVQYLDVRGMHYDFQSTGELYVQQPYNVPDHMLAPAKMGDVGMDFPVRILGMNGEDVEIKPKILVADENGKQLPEDEKYRHIDFVNGTITIPGGCYASLPSGLHVKIPDDAWGMIRPRSSTGWKKRISVFEGTIDPGYTGQIACLVFNPHTYDVTISDGDRLAQLVIVPKYDMKKIVITDTLPDTNRGSTGFGSSGN